MLVVGLTGNIASGKTTVATHFLTNGATLIDADALAREAVAPGQPGLAKVVRRFGPGVVQPDGTLDRVALRRIAFADAKARADLEAILHPDVEARRERRLAQARARGDAVVVCDIPLLFEAGLADKFALIVLVDATDAHRLERLVRDRHIPEPEAKAMLAAQMPAGEKRARAQIVIQNDGTLAELEHKAHEAWRVIERRAASA